LLSWALVRGRSCFCGIDHTLHEAVNLQHPVALEFLLQRGATDMLDEPCCGHRPLHRAIRMTREQGDVGYEMSRLLLEHGAKPNMGGDSPLHEAAASACSAAVGLLLDHSADPNATNAMGQTPLHTLCRRLLFSSGEAQERTAKVLLARGADPTRRDAAGLVPADYARGSALLPVFGWHRGLLAQLERAERWIARRTALLVRARSDGSHLLCRVPEDVFQAVVRCL